jgi:hypothetical protein
MPRTRKRPTDKPLPARDVVAPVGQPITLVWLKAAYAFHSFAYRDPRSAFSSAVGLPVVSPTAVLLGIASTLFTLGERDKAEAFLKDAHRAKVVIDPPEGVIFFRAFHQIRRYETDKYGPNPRMGLTDINQGTREYGLPEGNITIYVGVSEAHVDATKLALLNRDHLGTHDSLCSLVGDIEPCGEPKDVVYRPLEGSFPLPKDGPVTVVTLSRFRKQIQATVGEPGRCHWWMAGGDDTELVPYLIGGSFHGTTRGRVYRKHR